MDILYTVLSTAHFVFESIEQTDWASILTKG